MDEKINSKDPVNGRFRDMNTEQKILDYSYRMKVPARLTKQEALNKLNNRIAYGLNDTHTEDKVIFKISPVGWIISAAALLLVLIGIWGLWIYKPVTEIAAQKGQHMEYSLPDGSQVAMDADSRISFDKKDFIKNRILKLDGEAFFEVKKGSAFRIETPEGKITVLGTSFNVYAREDSFKVSCMTGKIKVEAGKNSLTIIPGESAMIRHNELISYRDKNYSISAKWREGEFYFENASLRSVLNEIERQFNVKFEMNSSRERFFTGTFTNKNLVNTLDFVCIPMQLNYEIGANGRIQIHEKSQ